jgi:predicted porin
VYDRLENSSASFRFAGIINAGPSKEGVDASAQGGTAGSTPTNQSTTTQIYAGTSGLTTVQRQIGALTYDFGSFSTNYLFAKSYVIGKNAGSNTTNTFGVKVPYEKFVFALSYGAGSVSGGSVTAATAGYIYGTANTKDRTLGVYYNIDKSTNIYLLSSNSTIIGTVGLTANQDGRNTTTAIGARYNF